jgi:hypothetical protein
MQHANFRKHSRLAWQTGGEENSRPYFRRLFVCSRAQRLRPCQLQPSLRDRVRVPATSIEIRAFRCFLFTAVEKTGWSTHSKSTGSNAFSWLRCRRRATIEGLTFAHRKSQHLRHHRSSLFAEEALLSKMQVHRQDKSQGDGHVDPPLPAFENEKCRIYDTIFITALYC